jgi:DNA-binding NarL/FixJ family response regulator
MDKVIRASIIDNDRMLMDSTVHWFSNVRDITITHTVETVDEYLSLRADDDIVLLDMLLDDDSDAPTNVARLVQHRYKVLVISIDNKPQAMLDALQAGAHGFLDKGHRVHALAEAIREVVAGEHLLPHDVAFAIARDRRSERPRLSVQELRAVTLYARGMTAGAVARDMNVSEKTVRGYLNRAADKYKAAGRPYVNKIELKERLVEDGIDPGNPFEA